MRVDLRERIIYSKPIEKDVFSDGGCMTNTKRRLNAAFCVCNREFTFAQMN